MIAGIIFLFCVYGISLSIRNIRSINANDSLPPIVIQPEQPLIQPKVNIRPRPIEPVYIEVQNTPAPSPINQLEPINQPEDNQFEPQMNVMVNDFVNNLTEEQQAMVMQRMQQGMQSMMQIWQNMTPEQGAQLQSTFQEMGQRFQNMTPEERQNVFQQFWQQ